MKISTAYDAFWFLSEHPKFRCREAEILSDEQAKTVKLSKGERLRRVKDEMPCNENKYNLREFILDFPAICCNLDIHYAKVDKHRKVNDNNKLNKCTECWLEFGQVKQAVSDGKLHRQCFHDLKLDCGAPTFDQAIVRLARLVRKHYGDIKTPKWIAKRKS